MEKSPTKKYRRSYHILSALSFLLTVFPLIYYIVDAYFSAAVTQEKVVLTCMVLCSIILIVINSLLKYHIRSTLWLLILGVYVCIDNVLPLLLMIAIGTILDEFIVSPCKKKCKNKYEINKEIDRRL